MSEQSQYYYFSISEAKIRIARTYYLNLIYFCRKYTISTRFYEFMLQKVLKFANYAVAVLVLKIILSCSNYAKNYASTIRQCLLPPPPQRLRVTIFSSRLLGLTLSLRWYFSTPSLSGGGGGLYRPPPP